MNRYPAPNSVIVIDNYATHKSKALHEAIEASGLCLVSLISLILSHVSYRGVSLSFCHLTCLISIPLSKVLVVVSSLCLCDYCDLQHPIVKHWLCQHWRQLQDSQYPERDLAEACFMAVTAEKA